MSRSLPFVLLGLTVSVCCWVSGPSSASAAATPDVSASAAKSSTSAQPPTSSWKPGMHLGQGLRRLFGAILPRDRSVGGSPGGGKSPSGAGALVWLSDYGEALRSASRDRKRLLVLIHPLGQEACAESLADQAADVPEIGRALCRGVLVKLPADTKLPSDTGEIEAVKHPSFAGLGGRPGLALIDFATTDPALNGRVVWTLPAVDGRFDLAELARGLGADPPKLTWMTDYVEAMRLAARQEKMLLVFFCSPGRCVLADRFEAETLSDPEVRTRLAAMVRVRLPLSAKAAVEGGDVVLLNHAAFNEMLGQPGLAIVDFVHKDPNLYGHVVSVFPFLGNQVYTTEQMKVILGLPPGTLTQRTLIYAVRTHPERPASTDGRVDPNLLAEAESHSQHQARIGVQGHHAWESRFHRINARLPAGCLAYEVCAESWPGQGLLQAAIECVRCWRTSSGHWRSVSSPSQAYGYDMKRGANGIWYATGIVGR